MGCLLMTMEDEIENMAEGSTGQTELPRKSLMQLPVSIPSKDVLKEFSKNVKPLFDLVYQNMESTKGLISLRDYLLPKLMSGEIDVSDLSLPN